MTFAPILAGGLALLLLSCTKEAIAQAEILTVDDSIVGHSKPAAPGTNAPAGGTSVDHRVIPLGRHRIGGVQAIKDPVLQPSNTTGPKSTLTQEAFIQKGTGSQTRYGRWGDYIQMSVDPTTGCTVWFTSQHQTVTGVFDWSTNIYHAPIRSNCQ
jgi:hypothetical protein